jgi:hypothetical protein
MGLAQNALFKNKIVCVCVCVCVCVRGACACVCRQLWAHVRVLV